MADQVAEWVQRLLAGVAPATPRSLLRQRTDPGKEATHAIPGAGAAGHRASRGRKSTVTAGAARLLRGANAPHALVDLAGIGAAWPVPDDDPWNERLTHRNLAGMWANFRDAGAVHAARGGALGCAGGLARAVIEAAHGRLTAAGTWALNEKRIVERAGLDGLTPRFARLGDIPAALRRAVHEVRAALEAASGPRPGRDG